MTDELNLAFDIHVISLPERGDRRRQLAAQFRKNGIDFAHVAVFEAVRPVAAAGFPSIGAHGCFLSHVAVMKGHIGKERPLLICEDDLDLAPDFSDRIPDVLAALRRDPWDIFFAGAHFCGQPAVHLAVRDPSAALSFTHMVAYMPAVLPRLVAYLEGVRRAPEGSARGPMHLDAAITHFRAEHPDVVTRVAVPQLGFQRASPSDVQTRGWHDRVPVARSLVTTARLVKNWLRRRGLLRHRPTA